MPECKPVVLPDQLEETLKVLSLGDLKRKVKDFYTQNLKGRSVKNIHKGITVLFAMSGQRHLLYARNPGYTKLKAVYILPELIQNAIFCNFKGPDLNDDGIVGYLNFRSKAKIEGKYELKKYELTFLLHFWFLLFKNHRI